MNPGVGGLDFVFCLLDAKGLLARFECFALAQHVEHAGADEGGEPEILLPEVPFESLREGGQRGFVDRRRHATRRAVAEVKRRRVNGACASGRSSETIASMSDCELHRRDRHGDRFAAESLRFFAVSEPQRR